MMDPQQRPDGGSDDELYVLQRKEILGPFRLAELVTKVEAGLLPPNVLVQSGGTAIWRPLEKVLLPEDSGAAAAGAIAPDWRTILTWLGRRVRHDVTEGRCLFGLALVGIGTAILWLLQWPLFVWLPWFAVAVVIVIRAIVRQRFAGGLGLAVLLAVLPVGHALLSRRPPGAAPSFAGSVKEATPPLVRAVASVAAPTPAPVESELPASTPEPVAPVQELPPLPPEPAPAIPKPAPRTEAVARSESSPALPPLPPIPASRPSPAPDPGSLDLVQEKSRALILINGREGAGSGFICRMDGQDFLVTNVHVVAGMMQPQFTALDGTRLTVKNASAAVGFDIFRAAPDAPPRVTFQAISDFESTVKIGDPIVVLGNSGGGGVVTRLEGKLIGIGPDRIEVDAAFIPGNSGSPIIHQPSGQVIGIATYLTRRYEEFSASAGTGHSSSPTIRRFGYRIDRVTEWQPVNWNAFQQEARQVEGIEQLTGDVFDFLGWLKKNGKGTPDFATETLRRPATQWISTIRRPHISPSDRDQATRGFLAALRAMVRADVSGGERQAHYDYFRQRLGKEIEVRNRLYTAFDEEAKKMSSTVGRFGY